MKRNSIKQPGIGSKPKSSRISNHLQTGGISKCETGLHVLSSRYMVMGVEVGYLTGLIEVDQAKEKE